MLVAGLFSNAAIAGNGDGEITVSWAGIRTAADASIGNSRDDPDERSDIADDGVTAPLAAGSRGNSLQVYLHSALNTISMAGGQLTIDIPEGWTILKQVQDKVATGTSFKEDRPYSTMSLVTVDDGFGQWKSDVEIYDTATEAY